MAKVTYKLSGLIEELCRERSCANACAVCLHNAINVANPVRADAKSRACSCANGVGGCHEGVAAEVHIEHGALCALAEDALVRAQEIVYLVLAVYNSELLHILYALHPCLLNFRNVEVGIVQ